LRRALTADTCRLDADANQAAETELTPSRQGGVPVADLDDKGPDFDSIVDRAATIFSAVEINKSLRFMIFIHSVWIFAHIDQH